MNAEHVVGVIFAGILGACLGSFANVLILRWHEAASITGRSACPHCKKNIRAYHLVPIFSWLFLRGKCAYCGAKIHHQYPLVEAVALLLGVVAALRWSPFGQATSAHFWFEFILTVGLLVPIVMDLRWQELPVEFLVGLSVLAIGWNVMGAGVLSTGTISGRALSVLLAIALAVAFFGIQVWLSKGTWLGMGDVWFGAFMGAALGWPLVALAVYLSYLIGGGVALVGLAAGRFRSGDRLPFGPILAVGTVVTLWYGTDLTHWLSQWF
jgi:leader peptidase (prepilin peptidase) / N-methyltransferase